MNWFRQAKLLPHEWFFGAFLFVQWLRLVLAAGPLDRDALLYFVLLLANVFVIASCRRHETNLRWQLRLWFYPLAMNAVFFTMSSAVLKVTPHKRDALLAGLDRALFGVTLSARAQAITTPALTEVLSFCYLLFFPYLVISWFYYAWRGLPLFRKLMTGLFTIYGLGFLGYSFVPAGGPHLALPDEFTVPLTGWAVTRFNALVVARGSNGVDVFPSLHCAVSCYLLFFDRQHARWRHRLYLVPCIGLWLATIYLRYHYFVDVAVGFALAAFGLWIANRWEKRDAVLVGRMPPRGIRGYEASAPARLFRTAAGLGHGSLRESSVRSAMFIAKLPGWNQAPAGAACCSTSSHEPDMPLLTELEHNHVEPTCYRHGAPNGAFPAVLGCEMSAPKPKLV